MAVQIEKKRSESYEKQPIDATSVLNRLDTAAKDGRPDKDRREDRRLPYRQAGIVTSIEQPGGGFTKLLANARNLSSGGIGLLVGSYIHPGSPCRVSLPKQDGTCENINGTVIFCRYVGELMHEIGVQFDRRIEPHMMLLDKEGTSSRNMELLELPDLHGKVLYVEDSTIDQRLLSHHLRASGIELTNAKNAEEALQLMKDKLFDIVISDLHLGKGDDGIALIEKMRTAGFNGPAVLLTAEIGGSRVGRAKQAGVDVVLNKPYQAKDIFDVMIDMHRRVGAFITTDQLFSSLEESSGMTDVILEYIDYTKQTAQELEKAILASDIDKARTLCLGLKGSATGVGFSALSELAREAVKVMDASMSLEEARPQLRMLGLMCTRLALRSATIARQQAEKTIL